MPPQNEYDLSQYTDYDPETWPSYPPRTAQGLPPRAPYEEPVDPYGASRYPDWVAPEAAPAAPADPYAGIKGMGLRLGGGLGGALAGAAAGTALFPGIGTVGGLIAGGLGGMLGSAGADYLVQSEIEDRPDIDWKSVAFEGAMGALPGARPLKSGATLLRALSHGAKSGAALGAIGGTLRPVFTEGKLPDPWEVGKETLLGAGLGGALGPAERYFKMKQAAKAGVPWAPPPPTPTVTSAGVGQPTVLRPSTTTPPGAGVPPPPPAAGVGAPTVVTPPAAAPRPAPAPSVQGAAGAAANELALITKKIQSSRVALKYMEDQLKLRYDPSTNTVTGGNSTQQRAYLKILDSINEMEQLKANMPVTPPVPPGAPPIAPPAPTPPTVPPVPPPGPVGPGQAPTGPAASWAAPPPPPPVPPPAVRGPAGSWTPEPVRGPAGSWAPTPRPQAPPMPPPPMAPPPEPVRGPAASWAFGYNEDIPTVSDIRASGLDPFSGRMGGTDPRLPLSGIGGPRLRGGPTAPEIYAQLMGEASEAAPAPGGLQQGEFNFDPMGQLELDLNVPTRAGTPGPAFPMPPPRPPTVPRGPGGAGPVLPFKPSPYGTGPRPDVSAPPMGEGIQQFLDFSEQGELPFPPGQFTRLREAEGRGGPPPRPQMSDDALFAHQSALVDQLIRSNAPANQIDDAVRTLEILGRARDESISLAEQGLGPIQRRLQLLGIGGPRLTPGFEMPGDRLRRTIDEMRQPRSESLPVPDEFGVPNVTDEMGDLPLRALEGETPTPMGDVTIAPPRGGADPIGSLDRQRLLQALEAEHAARTGQTPARAPVQGELMTPAHVPEQAPARTGRPPIEAEPITHDPLQEFSPEAERPPRFHQAPDEVIDAAYDEVLVRQDAGETLEDAVEAVYPHFGGKDVRNELLARGRSGGAPPPPGMGPVTPPRGGPPKPPPAGGGGTQGRLPLDAQPVAALSDDALAAALKGVVKEEGNALKNPTAARWAAQVAGLDRAKAPDHMYRDILSTGSKDALKKGETWRGRVQSYITALETGQPLRKGGPRVQIAPYFAEGANVPGWEILVDGKRHDIEGTRDAARAVAARLRKELPPVETKVGPKLPPDTAADTGVPPGAGGPDLPPRGTRVKTSDGQHGIVHRVVKSGAVDWAVINIPDERVGYQGKFIKWPVDHLEPTDIDPPGWIDPEFRQPAAAGGGEPTPPPTRGIIRKGLLDDTGSISNRMAINLAGGAAGVLYGGTQGDTPQERFRNAALWGVAGLGGTALATKAIMRNARWRSPSPSADIPRLNDLAAARDAADELRRYPNKPLTRWQQLNKNVVDERLEVDIWLHKTLTSMAQRVGHAVGLSAEDNPSKVFDVFAGGQGGLVREVAGRFRKISEAALNDGVDRYLTQYLDLKGMGHGLSTLQSKADDALRLAQDATDAVTRDKHFKVYDDLLEKIASGEAMPQGYTPQTVAQDMAVLRSQLTPDQFAKVEDLGNQVMGLNREALDLVHTQGIISPEMYAKLTARGQDYVPLTRVMDMALEANFRRRIAHLSAPEQKVILELRGSQRDTMPPMLSSAMRYQEALREVGANEAARRFVNLANIPDAQEFAQQIRALKGGEKLRAGEGVIHVYHEGKRIPYAVPEVIANVMHNVSAQDVNTVNRVLSMPASFMRGMATTFNVPFAMTNILRDFRDTRRLHPDFKPYRPDDLIKHIGEWGANFMHAMREDDIHGEFLKSRAAFSGMTSSIIDPETFYDPRALKELPIGKRLYRLAVKTSQAIEETPKMVAYRRSMAAGRSQIESAHLARTMAGTPDLAVKGVYGQQINASLMFFNASIQGVRRNIRHGIDHPGKFAATMAAASMTALAMDQYNHLETFRDSDGVLAIDKVPESTRRTSFSLATPYTYEDNDGTVRHYVVTISPKGHFDQLIYTPIESAIAAARGDKEPLDVMLDTASAMSPGTVRIGQREPQYDIIRGIASMANPVIRAPVEQLMNRETAFDIPIIPQRLIGHPSSEQYEPTTSPTMKWMADQMGKSPINLGLDSPLRMQALGRQTGLTTGPGEMGLSLLDSFMRNTGVPDTRLPAQGPDVASRIPVVGALARRAVAPTFDQQQRDIEERFYRMLQATSETKKKVDSWAKNRPAADVRKLLEDPDVKMQYGLANKLTGFSQKLGDIRAKRRILTMRGILNPEALEGLLQAERQTLFQIDKALTPILEAPEAYLNRQRSQASAPRQP